MERGGQGGRGGRGSTGSKLKKASPDNSSISSRSGRNPILNRPLKVKVIWPGVTQVVPGSPSSLSLHKEKKFKPSHPEDQATKDGLVEFKEKEEDANSQESMSMETSSQGGDNLFQDGVTGDDEMGEKLDNRKEEDLTRNDVAGDGFISAGKDDNAREDVWVPITMEEVVDFEAEQ